MSDLIVDRAYHAILPLLDDAEFLAALRAVCREVVVHQVDQPLPRELLEEIVQEYELLLCGIHTKLDSTLAAKADKLRIVASYSSGLDHIEVDAYTARGIKIVSVPHSNAISVAEHTWALVFGLAKCLPQGHLLASAGRGGRTLYGRPRELSSSVVGVIGAGPVAYQVMRIGRALDLGVAVWTLHPERHAEFIQCGAKLVDLLPELVRHCNILSINIALSNRTRGLITKNILRDNLQEKPIFLVNTSRAEVAERGALPFGLRHGFLLGCGLDVYYREEVKELCEHNVILTPHLGGLTRESIDRMKRDLIRGIREELKRGSMARG